MSFYPHRTKASAPGAVPSVEWEESQCPLCSGRDWSPLVEAPDTTVGGAGLWFVVVQCQECGLCFTNPRPNLHSFAQFYPASYRPHQPHEVRTPRGRSIRQRKWSRDVQRVLSWRAEGRLLDFGCGGGSFLARLHRMDWQVTGIDVSTAAVQRVRDELGLQAFVGTLPHPELRPESFDVVTMWHSLEHVHAPLEVLQEAHRLLVPGGRLVVAVPNIDSLPFRWFGPAWYGLDLPRHLTHFAPWTLHLMLERAGFRVGPVHMVRHSAWLRSSAKLAGLRQPPTHWQRLLKGKPFSRLASWYCSLTRQLDCMMVVAQR
ncbi:MAG TPA: class I SAM-dependent methyltransferase [Gemmataceae bacterium]|nr:class I SAM-dependent methyltransferase [Gemmataceae bacterium]